MLSNILLSRMTPYANEIIGEYQCGFRRDRSTVGCQDEEKDAFIEKLEQVSSVDNAVIMGDFNTQVGCHAEDKDAFTEKLDLISG